MTVVLDASAILAWAFAEPSAERVEPELTDGLVASPNWAEVLQKVLDRGRAPGFVGDTIVGLGLSVVPVDKVDAEQAGAMWERSAPLSLADRFCIAVGRRLDLPIWTCDRAWAGVDARVVLLR